MSTNPTPVELKPCPFAWTLGAGQSPSYKQYPQYINVKPIEDGGLRVTVRGREQPVTAGHGSSTGYLVAGETTSIDLPPEVAAEFRDALATRPPASAAPVDKLIQALRLLASGHLRSPAAPICIEAAEQLTIYARRVAELDLECERAWEAYRIAHDQAMENGSKLAELQNDNR